MSDFVTNWQRRVQSAERNFDRALDRTANVVQAVSRFQMNRLIYTRPPDRTKSGKPKWVQTRRLYSAEQAKADLPNDRIELTNTMPYAAARHELGRDGRKTTREAHWRDEALETMRREFNEALHDANIRTLEGR